MHEIDKGRAYNQRITVDKQIKSNRLQYKVRKLPVDLLGTGEEVLTTPEPFRTLSRAFYKTQESHHDYLYHLRYSMFIVSVLFTVFNVYCVCIMEIQKQ